MNGADFASSGGPSEPLVDLPLRPDGSDIFSIPPPTETASERPALASAPFGIRARAFAADAALVLLVVSASGLLAIATRGRAPGAAGVPWAAAFVLYLSFFTTVVPLALFGKTVGMALVGLSARRAGEARVTSRESALRWAGTLLAAAALGVPLLWTRRYPGARTPADRLSGRPLVESPPFEESPSATC